MSKKIYCEHGAITKDLRDLVARSGAEIIHFPYDPGSQSRRLTPSATPSAAQWRDMNLRFDQVDSSFAGAGGSPKFSEILSIIGPENRRDALHVDSAYKSGCIAIVTRDSDILTKRDEIESVIGIPVIDPDRNLEDLKALLARPDHAS